MQTPADIAQALDYAHGRLVALIESLDEGRLAVPYHRGINPPVWEGGHAAFFLEVFLLRPWLGRAPLMPGLDPVWDSFEIDHEDRWRPGVVPDKAATLVAILQTAIHIYNVNAMKDDSGWPGFRDQALEEIYRYPLVQSAIDTLNRQLKARIDDHQLAELVLRLREEGCLCLIIEGEENREPRLICTLGLI